VSTLRNSEVVFVVVFAFSRGQSEQQPGTPGIRTARPFESFCLSRGLRSGVTVSTSDTSVNAPPGISENSWAYTSSFSSSSPTYLLALFQADTFLDGAPRWIVDRCRRNRNLIRKGIDCGGFVGVVVGLRLSLAIQGS
jgi:hypothetical protein